VASGAEPGSPWQQIRAAATDRASGAAEIAHRAAEALAGISPMGLMEAIESLLSGHPSMAPLWRLATEVLTWGPAEGSARFLDRLEEDRVASESLAHVLPDSVVTISYSSTVAEAIRIRRPARVLCLRSEPGGEGERMAITLGSLTRAEVVEDDEGMRGLPSGAVVTGADAVTPEAVVNKVGTRALAEAAARGGVPCYAVAGETKFVATGLPVEELLEATPLGRFTAVATPWGLLSPADVSRRAGSAGLHHALNPLLERLTSAG
jgi:hypothetical protein